MTTVHTPAADPDHQARESLRLLGAAPENWVPAREGIDHNVVIVGGGQNGCAIAFALQRAGIGGVQVIDAAADAVGAGVWRTRARMHKLRTPKGVPGPELGLPGLGFQAWYEARHGSEAYAALDRIPRLTWADYLDWYRRTLDITVHYGTRLLQIEPAQAGPVRVLRLHLSVNGAQRVATTRKLVLANGVAGNGEPAVPEFLLAARAAGLASHTADAIDFQALLGQHVAVVGAAASAFDAAATALEAGAASVRLFARRSALAATPVIRTRLYPGIFDNFTALPDATRWHQAIRIRRAGTTAPVDSIERALRHPNFHLHLGSPWQAARLDDGQVVAQVQGQSFRFGHVIAGTGYRVEPLARPELAQIATDILRWRDRFTPPPDERDDALGASPYLGEGLEYLEKTPGTAPWLADIHVFNTAGMVSVGIPLGDVLSMRRDIPRVVARISRDLTLADLDLHETRIRAEVAPEFGAELYDHAVWTPRHAAHSAA